MIRMLREIRWLLRPRLSPLLSRTGGGARGAWVPGLAVIFLGWPVAFFLAYRLLDALRGVAEVGTPLAAKLLSVTLLICLGVLFISNTIAALSSFYLARDLPALVAAPVDRLSLYTARLGETAVHSSWMVVLLLVPVLVAYERVFGGGPIFYVVAGGALVPFVLVPAVAGVATTALLVRLFPARRTRDLLAVIAVLALALLVAALRILRPEELVRPEGYRNLVSFLATLRGPTSPWLPSEWAARAMTGFLQGRFDPFYLLLLWSTAAGTGVLGAALHGGMYLRCFTRAQEGADRRVRYRAVWGWLERGLGSLSLARRRLVLKDVRLFFRDTTQWSQLIILGVLVAVYVYNMRILPLQANPAVGDFLTAVVVFLNVVLAGFVLAAVAARFVFPAFSLEGPSLWLLGSSPLGPDDLVWSKFWTGAIPLFALGLALTLLTDWILGVSTWMTGLSLLTVTLLTLALTAQALAWGAAFPRFDAANAAEIPTSLGGLLFMAGALASLVVVVGGQLWILWAYLRGELPGRIARAPTAEEVLLATAFTLVVCGAVTLLPYRFARERAARLAE